MLEALAIRLSEQPPETVLVLLFLAALRPVGLMFGFIAFAWGMGAGFALRAAIGVALGLPMLLAGLDQALDIAQRQSVAEMALVFGKEVTIGLALGLLASLPFHALKSAGEVVDAFRGEANSGHVDADGASISTLGQVFLLTGFLVFFATGGLWLLFAMLYRTYAIWAVADPWPGLSADTLAVAADLIKGLLVLAIVTAAPLMLMMFAAQFVLAIAARAAERFHLMELDFLAKNLVTVLALPLIVLYVARIAERYLPDSQMALPLLEGFLR